MNEGKKVAESFSMTFEGEALEKHQIRARTLAQSLMALDVLAEKAANVQFGKKAYAELNVSSGFKPGSFLVDLVLYYQPVVETAEMAIGTIATVGELLRLGIWLKGRGIRKSEKLNNGRTAVYNSEGNVQVFNNCTVTLMNQPRVRSQADRLTAPLDEEGLEAITLKSGDGSQKVSVKKEDREYFKLGRGRILSYSEEEITLQVLTAQLKDPEKPWRFSEGDEHAYNAPIEDQDFLSRVRRGECSFKNGTMIRALVRKVQRMTTRLNVERTVVEVREVI